MSAIRPVTSAITVPVDAFNFFVSIIDTYDPTDFQIWPTISLTPGGSRDGNIGALAGSLYLA
jgi:hypothetical protein